MHCALSEIKVSSVSPYPKSSTTEDDLAVRTVATARLGEVLVVFLRTTPSRSAGAREVT